MGPKIEIRNLGLVSYASIDLKPLTILVGSNNTGKSHTALTIYALSRALEDLEGRTSFSLTRLFSSPRPMQWLSSQKGVIKKGLEDLQAALPNIFSGESQLSDLSERAQEAIRELSNSLEESFREDVKNQMLRCFGSTLQDLGRRTENLQGQDFEIALLDQTTGLTWKFRSRNDELIKTGWELDFSKADFKPNPNRYPSSELMARDVDFFAWQYINDYLRYLMKGYARAGSHYLPATRSGILQGHKTMASMIVGQASRAWIEPLEVPKLHGVTTDLIQALLLLDDHQRTDRDLRRIVEFLESQITEGTVGIDSRMQYPEIFFENELGRFDFHKVSSMISEMAPLVLFLKYLVRKNHLLIFEEPESHLDPSNQRNVARAIAMLVNAGVQVMVTTHSDILLNQINNLVQVGKITPRQRRYLGYRATEVLHADDIAVYLFKSEAGGTNVEPIDIDSDSGISTESSDKIHQELYEEALKLEHRYVDRR